MLRYLRENTGNWIIKIVLATIVIVFVFFGFGSIGSKRGDSVATVNDEPITLKEYEQAYRQLVETYRARFGNNLNEELLKILNARQQTLDGLIEKKIILSEADKLNILVTDKELQESLLALKAFQVDGQFNLERYKAVLSRNSLNPEIFEKSQHDALRQQKVVNMVNGTVTVSDMEAEEWYRFQNTKMSVDFVVFTPEDYADLNPDEADIAKFYAENKDNYKSEPKRKAVYIKFSPDDYKNEVDVNTEDIQAYYEQQQEKYQVPEKVEARHILIRVDENADEKQVEEALKKAQEIYQMALKDDNFEALAKKYSEGPSKDSGGYLGKFEKKSMVKPFADKAFSMEPGEVGEPVKTIFGWHIIKVLDKFAATTKTLAQVSDQIKKELQQQEAMNLAYFKAGEAFDAVIDGDDLDQVALLSSRKMEKTQAFGINGEGLSIGDSMGFAGEAFGLALDTISDVKQFGDDYYLIKVIEKMDPAVQAFEKVRSQVEKDLAEKIRREKAQKNAGAAVELAEKSGNLKTAAEKYGLKVNSTKLFTRTGRVEAVGNSPEFIAASFTLSDEKKVYPEVVESGDKFYLVGFKEKQVPKASQVTENLAAVKSELSWKKQRQSFQAWMGELKKHYKIDYDPNILK